MNSLPGRQQGIHRGGYEHPESRFTNRFEAGHGQVAKSMDGTFCSKFFIQCYEMALTHVFGPSDFFPFKTDSTCTSVLFSKLKSHSLFSYLGQWHTLDEPLAGDCEEMKAKARTSLESHRQIFIDEMNSRNTTQIEHTAR